MGNYLDFDLKIWGDGNRYYAQVIDSPAGSSQTLPLPSVVETPDKAELLRLKLENGLLRGARRFRGPPSSAEKLLTEFGQVIFDGVFGQSSPFATQFSSSVAIAEARRPEVSGLRVNLRIDPPELAGLPWEYLYDHARREWLGLNYRSPIIRFLVVDKPPPVLAVDGPLNVLGMIANPGGEWEKIDADEERNRIDRAIADLQKSGHINFCWVPGGTLSDLIEMMDVAPWHVFHFIGHGGAPAENGPGEGPHEGFIVLADEQGGAREVPASDLRLYLQNFHGSLKLVVLNSCDGAREGAETKFASPAASLIRSGMPAVVAMQFPISDDAAIQFGEAFYSGLAKNLPIEAALTSARIRIQAKSRVEWGIPVLYTRSRSGQLFSGNRLQSSPIPAAPARSSAQSEGTARARLRELFNS